MNMPAYRLIVFRVFLRNPEIVSLKIIKKISDEKFKNLCEQWYAIKFSVKLRKLVTEMKEMLDVAYNELIMSQISVYR